ncbi:MAG: hypothetical protein K2I49_02130, partial [Ureaplasma sp.]|nr:hypothetical protein [Ureaplasma sp.]
FAFNSVINLIKLDDLFNSIQNLIFSNGFSQSEFSIYVTQNQESIKELVANNLYLSQSNKFKTDDIISVLMRNSRLVITLNPDIEYSAEKNSNVILNNNLLTIYNFEYHQIINLTKLDVLWNAINDYIANYARKYTIDEFKNAITVSPNDIKKLVKSNLYININTTIALDKITNVSINENNQLEITLDNKLRYTMSSYNNAELVSNKLIIKNLNYFNLISISNTNKRNLETSIQNYITNNQVTLDNMDSHMSNINNLIFSTKTTDNQNLGNFVSSVTLSMNFFVVKLINYYKTDYNSDYIDLGSFTLADLRIVIGVNDVDLNNLWTSIQEYIWNNKVEVDNINSNNMSNINNLIFSTKTT